jgi:hypothetical protein
VASAAQLVPRALTVPRLGWAAAAVCTLVLAALATLPTWDDPGVPQDEGLLLVEPERLLESELPNRDFESFYGPTNTQLLAGVYAVTGPDVEAERTVGLVYRLALVGAVFALAAPAGILIAVVAGVTTGFFVAGPDALAWYGGLALLLWGLWFMLRASRVEDPMWSLRLAGILAGLAISFRPQFALAALLAALPVTLGGRSGVWRPLLGWSAVGLFPLWVHLALAGPVPVFENLVIDALFRSGPQSTLPYPPLSSDGGKLLLLLVAALVGLAAAAVVAWRRDRRHPEALRLAAIALLCLGLFPHVLGRVSAEGIFYVACVGVALAPSCLASPLLFPRVSEVERAIAATALTAAAMFIGARSLLDGIEANYVRAFGTSPDPVTAAYDRRENWVTWEGRSFPYSSAEGAADVREAMAAVDRLTEPGDRWIVGPSDLQRAFYNQTFLYHLQPDLEPGTYHLVMTPGTADRPGSRLPGEVASADVVLLGAEVDWHALMPNSELGSDDATEELQRHFCLDSQIGLYSIYARCR